MPRKTPRVSVFTPSHDSRFLDDCYESLIAQTYVDWEWVVLLNNGARWDPPEPSRRVRIVIEDSARGVGAAKRAAVTRCRGEFLVELDHDDILMDSALARVVEAFDAHPKAALVYSAFAQAAPDLSPDPVQTPFREDYGWTYTDVQVDHEAGELVYRQIDNMDASYPHNASLIWYAPNHVRAFRRTHYDECGGYDANRTVLDDQDLMCRLYQVGEFVGINECLYLQRVGVDNTQADPEINARIQVDTVALRDAYIQPMAIAWAERQGLEALDLGGAHNPAPGYTIVDLHCTTEKVPDRFLLGDVFEMLGDMPDNSVGVIRAVDFLEHIEDKIDLFNEMYRVLAHGGMLLSLTPSTDGRGAWQDPTHVAYYNQNSFWYFTEEGYARFVPTIRCRFQVSQIQTYFPSEWHVEHGIPYVQANLIAIKDGPRQGGPLHWS